MKSSIGGWWFRGGEQDAAVILIAETGGSGTFYYLSAAIFKNGAPNPTASIYLGDRLITNSLTIDYGQITLAALIRTPEEPMAAEPNVGTIPKYAIQD